MRSRTTGNHGAIFVVMGSARRHGHQYYCLGLLTSTVVAPSKSCVVVVQTCRKGKFVRATVGTYSFCPEDFVGLVEGTSFFVRLTHSWVTRVGVLSSSFPDSNSVNSPSYVPHCAMTAPKYRLLQHRASDQAAWR